jgi:hypothetical protein
MLLAFTVQERLGGTVCASVGRFVMLMQQTSICTLLPSAGDARRWYQERLAYTFLLLVPLGLI